MSEKLLTSDWIAFYGIIASVILGSLAYLVQKYIDRRYEILFKRRDIYTQYFAALAEKHHLQTITINDDPDLQREILVRHLDALGEMRKCYSQMLVVSSDTVCCKAARFQGLVGEKVGIRDETVFADAYATLLDAIRNEGFGRSRLSREDFEMIVSAKI